MPPKGTAQAQFDAASTEDLSDDEVRVAVAAIGENAAIEAGVMVAGDDEFVEQRIGLGDKAELDFKEPAILIYMGDMVQEKIVTNDDGEEVIEDCPAFLFVNMDGEQVFAWQTYALKSGLRHAMPGQRVRIEYIGDRDFKGKDSAGKDATLSTKRYKVALGNMAL